ncbi:hypothetical protein CGCA056_v004567 [Colletotrichum aenigma]|uniref:uncharacterized protein n=1 Tax=Colletotrichum aenigma TaxID=1215731 RepID=UPI001873088E|nr:uncharacterized protein CGCA056_v004567 [Colletotrichum aenigma]KAF5523890.1 hypothetical protein CGCA056_v004567 [Colletotrichum aenigma]
MGQETAEVTETQVLSSHNTISEKRSQNESISWLSKAKDTKCSLETVHKHGWKPMTLGAPVLFSFAFVSFILAVIIEILAQQSQKNGGLTLTTSSDDLPTYAKFGHLFLPTIVSVIYSLLWSWVDLDVKRIQPWLEMSKPAGAEADHSIFLDYPYDFVAFVPFRAAKRRHWPVFYGGTVMVIIFWLITPLQSAILAAGPINVRRATNISSLASIRPLAEQPKLMDTSILNEGYSLAWLNQSIPPFSTPEYTLLPFTSSRQAPQVSSTNWTGQSVKYWTELSCWPGVISQHGASTKFTYDFNNGRGCNASDVNVLGSLNDTTPFQIQYFGYQNSAWADYWLAQPTCPKSSAEHQFLAVWSRYNATLNKFKMASTFCETNYFKQSVNVTVSAVDQTPIENSIVPLGPRERLQETEFNYTAFEHLLGAGVSPVELDVKREFPFGRLLEHYQQVSDLGLNWPLSPMAGFAIAMKGKPPLDAFNNATYLGEAYNATHKMLFTLALRHALTNTTNAAVTEGHIDFILYGIIVSRLFSAIVEGLLGLVGFFTILLWWHSYRAPSRLTMDPASLGSIISLCQNSSVLLDRFAGKGCLPEEKLKEAFRDQRFKLFCGCQSRSRQMIIKVVDIRNESYDGEEIEIPDASLSVGHYSPVKPLALRRDVGATVVLSMVGAIVALAYLKVEETRIRGLIRPTTNFEVLQILENYVPTIFATLLEPFWVLVNRLLCLMQPFRDLWRGRRTAEGSIDARYTSLPPQFVIWRAARSGHFMLTAMCFLALLSNLLAVGLGGLFNEFPIVIETERKFQQTLKPQMTNANGQKAQKIFRMDTAPYETPYYAMMNNISQGTPLPPWITKDWFFQQFSILPGENDTGDTYTARTHGFGTIPSCSAVGPVKSGVLGPVINHTFVRNGEAIPDCPTTYRAASFDFNTTFQEKVTGPATSELVDTLGETYGYGTCNIPLIVGYGRRENNETMESLFVVCEPTFTTAVFDVTVDPEGYVLSSEQASEASSTLDYPLSTNDTDTITVDLNKLVTSILKSWHNDTLSKGWLNYLLRIQPGLANLHDPDTFPNVAELVPTVERTYRQLYVLMMGLNDFVFDEYPEPVTISGVHRKSEIRIFMDITALVITMAVLSINILVAIPLYSFSIKHFLPRLPTNIGSILAYIAPSRALREYDGDTSRRGETFSFGRYVGEDGRAHVGIELDPFVVPVKLSALKKGDTEPRRGIMRRILGRRKAEQGDETWL